jgi:hypothetical protein
MGGATLLALTVLLAGRSAHAEDWRDKLKREQEEQSSGKNEKEPSAEKPPADLLAPSTGSGSILSSNPAAAESDDPNEPYKNTVQISLGAYLPWMNRFTRTTSGEVSPTGQVLPTLGAAYRFHWERLPGLSFSGQGWFTPMGAAIADGAGTTRWLSGALIAGLQEKQAEFRLGTGVLLELIRGAGGTIELGNAGSTATFYQPGRSVVGRVLTLNLGFSYQRGRWRYEADGMIVGALSSRRSVGLVLQAGYGLF